MSRRPSRKKHPLLVEEVPFVAIDFETADRGRDSACSVALVRVEGGQIVRREHRLIRPPRPWFEFDWLHGITWERVKDEPQFAQVWMDLREVTEGAGWLVAHNSSFDRGVLSACCQEAGLDMPVQDFACSMRFARSELGIYPTKLSNVCQRLGIPLQHHDALSDAEACARIVLAARGCGTLAP